MDLRQTTGASPDAVRMASLWTLIGDTAQAVDWLDRAYAERHPALIFLRFLPSLEGLRTHPRFVRIASEMKLPPR